MNALTKAHIFKLKRKIDQILCKNIHENAYIYKWMHHYFPAGLLFLNSEHIFEIFS